MNSATETGLRLEHAGAERILLLQRGSVNVNATDTRTLTGTTPYLVLASHKHSINTTRIWVASATAAEYSHTFSATTDNATGLMRLAARIGAGTLFGNGGRFYSFAMGNEYLDNTKAAAIIAHLEPRHGRTYA